MDLTGLGSVADLAKGLVDRFLPAKMTGKTTRLFMHQKRARLQRRQQGFISQKS